MKSRSIAPVELADCFAELARLFGAPLEEFEIAALGGVGYLLAVGVLAPPGHPALLPPGTRGGLWVAGDPAVATSRFNSVFCRLFLGLGGASAALPIESAHRGDGRLFQEPASIISEMLIAHDLVPARGFAEPPDHLAVELSLLEQLIRLEASLVDADEHAAISVLRRRLVEWTPSFAAAVAENDPTGFYAALARILVRLLTDVAPEQASAA